MITMRCRPFLLGHHTHRYQMMEIKQCIQDTDFAIARRISTDYVQWLDMDLTFQDIDHEFADFESVYGPPAGAYLLAYVNDQPAGGVGLRKFSKGICEMKRLYVYDPFKHQGIGRALCKELIRMAKHMGYTRMRLDTIGRLKAAIKLYERLGFKDIDQYRHNPDPTTRYMELNLR